MPDNDLRLLTPERLEEIRARADASGESRLHSGGWRSTRQMQAEQDRSALLAHITTLTTQRDHYHTEWTARGTALLQLHQDLDVEKRKQGDLAKLVERAAGWFDDNDLSSSAINLRTALHHVHLSASSTEVKSG